MLICYSSHGKPLQITFKCPLQKKFAHLETQVEAPRNFAEGTVDPVWESWEWGTAWSLRACVTSEKRAKCWEGVRVGWWGQGWYFRPRGGADQPPAGSFGTFGRNGQASLSDSYQAPPRQFCKRGAKGKQTHFSQLSFIHSFIHPLRQHRLCSVCSYVALYPMLPPRKSSFPEHISCPHRLSRDCDVKWFGICT